MDRKRYSNFRLSHQFPQRFIADPSRRRKCGCFFSSEEVTWHEFDLFSVKNTKQDEASPFPLKMPFGFRPSLFRSIFFAVAFSGSARVKEVTFGHELQCWFLPFYPSFLPIPPSPIYPTRKKVISSQDREERVIFRNRIFFILKFSNILYCLKFCHFFHRKFK